MLSTYHTLQYPVCHLFVFLDCYFNKLNNPVETGPLTNQVHLLRSGQTWKQRRCRDLVLYTSYSQCGSQEISERRHQRAQQRRHRRSSVKAQSPNNKWSPRDADSVPTTHLIPTAPWTVVEDALLAQVKSNVVQRPNSKQWLAVFKERNHVSCQTKIQHDPKWCYCFQLLVTLGNF